jgi:hypothetical protein
MRGNGAITDRRAPGHLFNYGIGLDAAIDAEEFETLGSELLN